MPLKKLAELTVQSHLDSLTDVDQFTERNVSQIAALAQQLDDIAISVSEAVNNAIVHGNKLDDTKVVRIRFYLGSNFLRIVVQDQGVGFTPEEIPDPRKKENLLKASGRGILIIRHLMDRVCFKHLKHGMRIIMDKSFAKA
ncbi:MAG: ATP-binding protein [bacterium]